jgi:hypothetical protein
MLVKISGVPIASFDKKVIECLINTDHISMVNATVGSDGRYSVGTNINSWYMNQSQFSDFEKKLGVKIPVNKE